MFRKYQDSPAAPAWESLALPAPPVPSRACCCPARPIVRIIMPPAANRPHPVDLWLCGHHYRASIAALFAAGATVEDLTLTMREPEAEYAGGQPTPGSLSAA